jgi:hypothetical protein
VNIALPGILIILGLVPGIIFYSAYYSGSFPKQFAAVSPVSELAQYVLFAVPLDLLGFWLHSRAHTLDFDVTLRLITGSVDPVAFPAVSRALQSSLVDAAKWYILLLIVAAGAGSLIRHLVWATRLDLRLPFLRMRNTWYYPLLGRLQSVPRWSIIPHADVMTELGNETRLFRGIVSDFEGAADGTIKSLVLVNAQRGKGRGDLFKWQAIPGDRLILLGASIQSINMAYLVVDSTKPAWRLWLRSFFLTEP